MSKTSRRAFASSLAGAVASAQTARRPNILVLLTDDQRYDTVGALGHPDVRTPNIDRLVRSGTTFTQACIMGGTVGAVCVPSRGMLLTGQYLFPVHDNLISSTGGPAARPYVLFPEVLRDKGYVTFGTGKWHNGPRLYQRCFTDGGNIFFGGMSDHARVPVTQYDRSGAYPQTERRAREQFSSELFAGAAVRFLERYRGSEPFLLYVAFTSPHDPRTPPERFARMYDASRLKLPPNFMPQHPFDNGDMKLRDEMLAGFPRTEREIRRHIAEYYGMVSEVDAQIGRVLRALEASPHAPNTVVVYAADNGLACGQHGLMGKQNLYDHSIRVPLMMSGPGVRAGRRVDGLCYLLDVCPTLLELAGIRAPKEVQGESIVPALSGGRTSLRGSVMAAYRDFQRAVRTGTHKLIEYKVGGERTTQLFDLRRDPWEMRNLAGEQPARVSEMRRELRGWMQRADDPREQDFFNALRA